MITNNPTIAQPAGCWQNFLTSVSNGGAWLYEGIKKIANLALCFFASLGSTAKDFVILYARELSIASIALGVGIAIGLILNRCLGCCNKPEGVQVPQNTTGGVAVLPPALGQA